MHQSPFKGERLRGEVLKNLPWVVELECITFSAKSITVIPVQEIDRSALSREPKIIGWLDKK